MRITFGPLWTALLTAAVLLGQPGAYAEDRPAAAGVLEMLDQELIGVELHNMRGTLGLHDGALHFTTITDMVHGAGQGHNLMLWQRPPQGALWRVTPLRPDRKPAMIRYLPLPDHPGQALLVYVDREDEAARVVYVDRLSEEQGLNEILAYADNRGVLNPIGVPVPGRNVAHIFIPDRGSDWRIRWFRVNLETDEVERLEDIPMPRQGARLFDYHLEDTRLLLPVGLARELHLLEIDLDAMTHTLHQVDEANSPDNQPCREIALHAFPELELYLLTYLRPTAFSDRPRTGLLGEVVATALRQDTLEPLKRHVIGGYRAEEAATHQVSSAKVADDAFVVAYTTVDSIHQRHLTGEFINYVASHLDRWQLDANGGLSSQGQHTLDPFWRVDLATDEDEGILYLMGADTRETFPLWLQRWRVR